MAVRSELSDFDKEKLAKIAAAVTGHTRRKPRRNGNDGMGYPLKPLFAEFTDAEINAAKTLARAAGYSWDVVNGDPRVFGWPFLEAAKIVSLVLANPEN